MQKIAIRIDIRRVAAEQCLSVGIRIGHELDIKNLGNE